MSKILKLLSFALFVFIYNLTAQQPERHEIIAAYVFNFAKNIQWQNENLINAFNFVLLGNDSKLENELSKLARTKTLRNKPITFKMVNEINKIGNAHLLFMTKNEELKLPNVYDFIEGKNILLVTDSYQDKRLIMLNLFQTASGNILFEINKANIINQKLLALPDMILLGGTEIDIAELYREGQQNLRILQKEIEKIEKTLNELQNEINIKTKQIEQQSSDLVFQANEIEQKQLILKEHEKQIEVYKNEIEKQLKEIKAKQKLFSSTNEELEKQKEELKTGYETLNELNKKISVQSRDLENKSEQIEQQQNIQFFLIIILMLAVSLALIFYMWYKNKNRMANLLEQKVALRTSELKKLNDELEHRVNLRTQELQKTTFDLSLTTNKLKESNSELTKEIESRKQIEKSLVESEKRLEDILNYAPILVYMYDKNIKYVFVNKEFERLSGLKFEEIINKTDAELFPQHRAERNIRQINKVLETKQSQVFENESQKQDGTHYFVDILFPILDNNNEIYSICGWSIDITDRKRSEEVLKDAKEKAESADRLKSAFLATMSHELRTPLNSIIGFTGILMKGIAGPLNDEQMKQLGMAKGSAQHLLALINDVLDISKIESGQLIVAKHKFDFPMMLKRVVESVRPLAEKKKLDLILNIDSQIKEVISDERRVGQIFLNLINNAIKFTETGSVKVNSNLQNGNIVTQILDTGIGIKIEDLDKLFKPFSQVDIGITRNHEGTGLGLSISQRLAEKLDGKITVESKFGAGSIFTVTLPIN